MESDTENRRTHFRHVTDNSSGILGHVAFDRITADPDRMGGVPCIRDLRMPVATVVGMVADGMTTVEILAEHPDLEAEDVRQVATIAS